MGNSRFKAGITAICILLAPTFLLAQETTVAPQAQSPLPWAYALNTPGAPVLTDPGLPFRIPGSARTFTFAEVRNLYLPPDWHPDTHPLMPPIVAQGRNPGVFACGYCHLPNGQGRPENASITGLPAAYIVQQFADYKAGLRTSAEPRHGPATNMLAIGHNATDTEIAEAAAYFSALKPKPWIRVVETDTVPRTLVSGWMFIADAAGGTEALGQRIVEMPEDLERTEVRDDSSGFIAYVPKGSIARGKLLASAANSKVPNCNLCHGENLHGLGPVPALAGRSPSYLARQLYDMQSGHRKGLWSPLMQNVVSALTLDDIVDLTAYLASLEP